MSYCQKGSRAKVNFKFSNGYQDSVVSQNPPVEVTTSSEKTKITYASNWYHPPNHPEQFDIVNGRVTWNGNCQQIPGQRAGQNYARLSNGFEPRFNGGCGVTFEYLPCEIQISDATGSIYQKMGQCPINYTVQCDDECPEGHIRCETTNYPGYCCIPCNEIKSEIQSLTSLVRSIHNG